MNIRYLSYGTAEDGGTRHEREFAEALKGEFPDAQLRFRRYPRLFKGLLNHLNLLYKSFRDGKADICICVTRCAVPVLLRNAFSNRKTLVVWHYHSDADGKGTALKMYYRALVRLLKLFRKKAAIVTVAPYWQDYFTRLTNNKVEVFTYPNLLDPAEYAFGKNVARNDRLVHLGQWSSKNHPQLHAIAMQLKAEGYSPWYVTLYPEEAGTKDGIEILHFEERQQYLQHLSESKCCLAMTAFPEGWNRIAHESILLGTPVAGLDMGGLGDLLRASGAQILDQPGDAIDWIKNGCPNKTERSFGDQYSPNRRQHYLSLVLGWLQKQE